MKLDLSTPKENVYVYVQQVDLSVRWPKRFASWLKLSASWPKKLYKFNLKCFTIGLILGASWPQNILQVDRKLTFSSLQGSEPDGPLRIHSASATSQGGHFGFR